MYTIELSKEKNELDSEIQLLQGEVESKSVLILTLQSQLEVIYVHTNHRGRGSWGALN